MPKDTSYVALKPDAQGRYPYTAEDQRTWARLYRRQMEALRGKVVPEYFDGVRLLELTAGDVPQVVDIDRLLARASGAGVEGVPAIIPPTQFFTLLSQRRFPIATFLRRPEHMDYIEEPDLFHEVFGHCPLLTQAAFADFIEGIGKRALALDKADRWYLFRLFWFTVEFGMIHTKDGVRGYGAGIVSSPAEAEHALSGTAELRPFDLLDVLRTPYRIDIVQPLYFVINSFEELAACLNDDLEGKIAQARHMGDTAALFETA